MWDTELARGDRVVKKIYCDEAGFTGSNLLNPDQPVFTMASVHVTEDRAEELMGEVRRRSKTTAEEVKGARLVRTERGRAAIDWLISDLSDDACVVLAHKRYSLCCKFFEFMVEPIIKRQSSIFYEAGFHEFVATGLFVEFLVREGVAEQLLLAFENSARGKEGAGVDQLLACLEAAAPQPGFLKSLSTICNAYQEAVKEELAGEAEGGAAGTWSLDLSTTCLVSLLSHWSEKHGHLEVVCDESRPITVYSEVLDSMVGRESLPFTHFGGVAEPVGWLLAKPIALVDSRGAPGVQIADLLATSCAYYARHGRAASSNWFDDKEHLFHSSRNIYPDLAHFDLRQVRATVNAIVLSTLDTRAESGDDPTEGMDIVVQVAREMIERDGLPF